MYFQKPKTFDLSLPEATYLQEHLSTITKLGFEIEPFGNHTFKLTACLNSSNSHIPALLAELLDEVMQEKGEVNIDRQTHRTIAYLACRSAVMAGDYLTPDERRRLVEKLRQTKAATPAPTAGR